MTVKATSFQVIEFIDPSEKKPKPVILLYALGEDGIIYEMSGGKWRSYPIEMVGNDNRI
jgi:hypothetical protein